jgi:hypothetical protein
MSFTPSLSTAAASTSVAMAIAILIRWFFSFFHITITPDVETAFATIAANVIHWLMANPYVFNRSPKNGG